MAFWTIKMCIDWCKTWCYRNERYFEWEYVWWRAHFAAAIKIYELFMNLLYKNSPTPIPLFVRKGTFSKSNMMNKIWFRKVKYKCSHIIVGKGQLMSWKVCASEFIFLRYTCTSNPEWIYYIYSYYFYNDFFYSLIYLNNLISNSCINRF